MRPWLKGLHLAFPHGDRIAEELVRYIARQPGGRIHGTHSYAPLSDAFAELTPDDRESRVPTGELRGESKVRFARQRLGATAAGRWRLDEHTARRLEERRASKSYDPT